MGMCRPRYCADGPPLAPGRFWREPGGDRSESEQGYNAVVEELLNPDTQPPIDEDLMMRYHPAYNHSAAIETNVQQWLYRMINTPRQLQEKMTLFWHMIFCAGHSKIDSGEEMAG